MSVSTNKKYDIILCGAYGSGKTTVATLVAQLLKSQLITEPVDYSASGAEMPMQILKGSLLLSDYILRIENHYKSADTKISRRPTQQSDVIDSIKDNKQTTGKGNNASARAKLLNEALDKLGEQWSVETMTRISTGVDITVWDCDAATLLVAAPYQTLPDNYNKTIYDVESRIREEKPHTHSVFDADIAMVLSNKNTLLDIMCLIDNDIAMLKTGSSHRSTRYVLLTETSEETKSRVEGRKRTGDSLIANNAVIGMQFTRLAMFFGIAPPCDNWIANRRNATVTISRFAGNTNGEIKIKKDAVDDSNEAEDKLDRSMFTIE